MTNRAPRIALVRLSALGDIVNSAVVLQLIKKHYRDALIDWFCEESFAPLLQQHPDIHAVHTVALKRLKKERRFSQLKAIIKALQSAGPYDYVIDMQGLIKSAVVARVIGKNVHGFDRHSIREKAATMLYDSTSSIPYEANVIKRNVKVVCDALGFTCNESEIVNKAPLFEKQERPESFTCKHNIIIIVGASWPSKQYPKEQYAALCKVLTHPCHIVWGSEHEREMAQWISQQTPNAILAPAMPLKALLNFIAHADLVIGNDTGPTHMAWAMNRPSITLFGPTNSRMIYETPKNIAIESPSEVNILKIDRNDFSIAQIPPEYIAQKARELL